MNKPRNKKALLIISIIVIFSTSSNLTFAHARKYTVTLTNDDYFVVGPKWIVGDGSILWSFSSSNPFVGVSVTYIGESGLNSKDSYDWWVDKVSNGSYAIDSGLIGVGKTSRHTLIFELEPDNDVSTKVSIEVIFYGHGKFLVIFIVPPIILGVALGLFIGIVAIRKRTKNSTYS